MDPSAQWSLALAIGFLGAVTGAAPAGTLDDERGPADGYANQCASAIVTLGGQRIDEAPLVDGASEACAVAAASDAELVVTFRAAPRWLDTIAVQGSAAAWTFDVRDPYGTWHPQGRIAGDAGIAILRVEAIRAAALRIRPVLDDPEGDERVAYAEVEAYFIAEDPDDEAADGSSDGREYFYEWIEDYDSSPLYDCEDDAKGLCDGLASDWSCRGYGDWSAWEEDFKRTDLGGTNGQYVDSADLAYFSGHGGRRMDSYWGGRYRSMVFADSRHDDTDGVPGDARGAWDADLEWMAFSGCNILSNPSRSYWHEAMIGVHALFGWADSIPDIEYGNKWAREMNGTSIFDPAKTMKQAWFDMAEAKVGAGYKAIVIGETPAMGDDYLWGEGATGADPTHNGTYWLWTYTTTSGAAVTMPTGAMRVLEPSGPRGLRVRVPEALLEEPGAADVPRPVFGVVPPEVTVESVEALRSLLCDRFPTLCEGEPCEPTTEDTINAVSGFHELRVSTLTGGWEFLRSDEWWRTYEEQPELPGEAEAVDIASELLAQLELLPPDGEMWRARSAIQAEESSAGGELITVFEVHRQVVYRRRLADLPVFGAGGQMSVCVGPTGIERVNRSAWRDLEVLGQVEPITLEQALARVAAIGADAAIDGIGAIVSELTVVGAQLGYYEYDDQTTQHVLPPVWYVYALGSEDPEHMEPIQFAIQADPIPLQVQVQGPVGEGEVCFLATASGGLPPYAFAWSSSTEGPLGEDPTLCYAPDPPMDPDKGMPTTHVVTVAVTDAAHRVQRARVTYSTCAVPDLDGNGFVGVGDLLVLLQQWGAIVEPGTGADLSGDGQVGVSDLLILLQAWGDRC